MKKAIVKTVSTDPTYNPDRWFRHYGFIDNNGDFIYDGNWEAIDNTLYNFIPENESLSETIANGNFELVCFLD